MDDVRERFAAKVAAPNDAITCAESGLRDSLRDVGSAYFFHLLGGGNVRRIIARETWRIE